MITDDRSNLAALAATFKTTAAILEASYKQPHGAPANDQEVEGAKRACVKIFGNTQLAGSYWREIESELGYIPRSIASALIRLASSNRVPLIEAPND